MLVPNQTDWPGYICAMTDYLVSGAHPLGLLRSLRVPGPLRELPGTYRVDAPVGAPSPTLQFRVVMIHEVGQLGHGAFRSSQGPPHLQKASQVAARIRQRMKPFFRRRVPGVDQRPRLQRRPRRVCIHAHQQNARLQMAELLRPPNHPHCARRHARIRATRYCSVWG